jgi:hypothetical protein
MLHAYRLVYPCSPHAPPQLWEYEQPYIHNLILNARTFDRRVVQWYFKDWEALARDNTRIWETYYRPYPLYDHLADWEVQLVEYRASVVAAIRSLETAY